MDGVKSKFKAVGEAELVEDVVQMVFYGLLADEELSPISLLRKP